MKILNFFSAVFLVFTLAFWYSCTKENVTKDVVSNDLETELREDPPCENAIGNCPFTNHWKKDTLTGVTIDLYPGCTFYVIYEYKECTTLPPNSVIKFDVRIVLYGYWPICAAFEADYVINPFVISQVSKKLMEKIVDELMMPYLALIPLCSSGEAIELGFSQADCVNYCRVKTGDTTTPGGELIDVKLVPLPCGKACCVTSYKYCKNPDGSINKTKSISSGTGNCALQSPLLPCPMNTLDQTGCLPNCYLL